MTFLVGDLLTCAAAAAPGRIAATLRDEVLTFGEADRRANRAGNALRGLGVRTGDRVVSWTDMLLCNVDVFFGVARIGAVFVPLNPAFGLDEATASLAYLRPRLLLCDAAHEEVARTIGRNLDVPVQAFGTSSTTFTRAMEQASEQLPDGPRPDERAVHAIFMTSGSTGRPKGVMLSHRASWIRCFPGVGKTVNASGAGEVSMFPLFHWAGWSFLLECVTSCRPLHFTERSDADLLMTNVERWHADVMYGIPAIWDRILQSPERRRRDLSSLRVVATGTSRVSQELLDVLKAAVPKASRVVSYGSTEGGRVISLREETLVRKPGSVGFPVAGVFARIEGDGELLLRSEMMMDGYFELPEESNAVLAGDGWYRTGDVARRDEDGYFWITGRKREIIRTGGESVAPAEVEAVVATMPGVRECAVVGIPDERWGEIICAVLVLEPGVPPPSVEALRAHIGTRLAPFKHPRRVEVLQNLPHTAATGQSRRSAIRATMLDSLDAHHEPS